MLQQGLPQAYLLMLLNWWLHCCDRFFVCAFPALAASSAPPYLRHATPEPASHCSHERRYWDAQTGNCVSLQDPDSAVRCIHLDPVGRQLVAGTEFGRLMLWDTDMLDELLAAGLERVRQEFERIRPSDHGASRRQVGLSEDSTAAHSSLHCWCCAGPRGAASGKWRHTMHATTQWYGSTHVQGVCVQEHHTDSAQ